MTDDEHCVSDAVWAARTNYAWDWFQFHSKQRTDMFNYYLVATGLLANGYVATGLLASGHTNLHRENHWLLAAAVALVGFIVSIGFCMMDIRNKQLVDMGANILAAIEEKRLFADESFGHLGLSRKWLDHVNPVLRHTFIFRSVQIFIAAMWAVFFLAIIHSR